MSKEREPLDAEYVHSIYESAKRAIANTVARTKWGTKRHGSPIVTMALCEEIDRLNIAFSAARAEAIEEAARLVETELGLNSCFATKVRALKDKP